MSGVAIITGASGFVGTALRAYFKKERWDVFACDLAAGDRMAACDVTDPRQVAATFNAAEDEFGPPTHVFHLAAITSVPEAVRAPEQTLRVSRDGTENVARAILERGAKTRLVYISSSEVYGAPLTLPVNEMHPVAPLNPYAASKAAAEAVCANYAGEGLDVIVMRPFNHTGPGQDARFALPAFARQIALIEAGKMEPAMRTGNLDARRDFLHVNDVLRAYEKAALWGRAGETYNVCSGESRRIGDALEKLLSRARADIEVHPDPELMRPSDIADIYGSYAKVRSDTAWEPAATFEEMLAELLDYWRTQLY